MAMLPQDVANIMFGTMFLVIGFASCVIATARRRQSAQVFVWLGIWSALFGFNLLLVTSLFVQSLPPSLRTASPYLQEACAYLMVPAATLAYRYLTLRAMRRFNSVVAMVGSVLAIAAFSTFVVTGSSSRFSVWNSIIAVVSLLVLIVVVVVPSLSRKYLVLHDRGVLAAGTIVFAVEALLSNISAQFGYRHSPALDCLGFAFLLFAFGYAAMRMVVVQEHRLLSIESELEVAREIQASILPESVPEPHKASIAAVYEPMSAVAGDFYEFISVDQHRVGILVADVAGHGVPAALVASMLKVATQSVLPCAADPAAVMRQLNRLLCGQLRGHLVSAAYLWLDTEKCTASYSAAGHPPLLRWSEGKLDRVESNGLLFGVFPEADYPRVDFPVSPQTRLVLYTDGITDPENAAGEAFGERRLEQMIRNNESLPAREFLNCLLKELRSWQPGKGQQDDITVLAIDLVGEAAHPCSTALPLMYATE